MKICFETKLVQPNVNEDFIIDHDYLPCTVCFHYNNLYVIIYFSAPEVSIRGKKNLMRRPGKTVKKTISCYNARDVDGRIVNRELVLVR